MPESKTERDSPSLETGVSTKSLNTVTAEPPPSISEDTRKNLRLLGGLLRFEAINPTGLTLAALAKHAGIPLAGVSAFLASPTGQQFAEAVGNSDDSADTLFHLRTENRADLLQQITANAKR